MRRLLTLLTLTALLAAPSLAKEHKKDGVTFSYPEGWTVTEEPNSSPRLIFVESPGDAIMAIFIYDESEKRSLKALAKQYSDAVNDNMPPGMTAKSSGFKEVKGSDGNTLRESVKIVFMNTDVPHLRHYVQKKSGGHRTILVSQFAVEDRKDVEDGFKLVETTYSHQP